MKLSNFFFKKSTWPVAIGFTILVFGYLFLIFIDAGKCYEVVGSTQKTLGLSFGFSLETVQAFFAARTSDMMACYHEFLSVWDNLFALLYGFMYLFWLALIFKPYQAKAKWLIFLPFLQSIFDWLENMKLASIADSYVKSQTIDAADVALASNFTMAKWLVSSLVFFLVLVGIGLRIGRYLKRKKS